MENREKSTRRTIQLAVACLQVTQTGTATNAVTKKQESLIHLANHCQRGVPGIEPDQRRVTETLPWTPSHASLRMQGLQAQHQDEPTHSQ